MSLLRHYAEVAQGFQLELVKWIAIVRLLLGEIPERKMLLGRALTPYFELTQAVRMVRRCRLNTSG